MVLAADAEALPLISSTATFKVGGDGGWDLATLGPDGRVLYVTRGTYTMAVDVADGKIVADIGPQQRSHGVALVPDLKRGFISDGGAGTVQIFDLHTHAVLGSVPAAADADSIIYDRASNRVLVMCGDAHQLVAFAPDVNPSGGNAAATVDLGGAPEFAVADGKGKVFVNIADEGRGCGGRYARDEGWSRAGRRRRACGRPGSCDGSRDAAACLSDAATRS